MVSHLIRIAIRLAVLTAVALIIRELGLRRNDQRAADAPATSTGPGDAGRDLLANSVKPLGPSSGQNPQ